MISEGSCDTKKSQIAHGERSAQSQTNSFNFTLSDICVCKLKKKKPFEITFNMKCLYTV